MHNFGEKKIEKIKGKEYKVVQTSQYLSCVEKAVEIIDKSNYGVNEDDFWILKNADQANCILYYTALIISHRACMKINDKQDKQFQFVPSSVTIDKSGYGSSLVCVYSNDEQGIFETGEASSANCKNAYPYAMAKKRLFDRVVLSLSKLSFAGIMSDSEVEKDEVKTYEEGDEPFDPSQFGMKKIEQTVKTDEKETMIEKGNSIEDEYQEALNFEIPFGKYKGKNLREVFKLDRAYIRELSDLSDTDKNVKAKIKIIEEQINLYRSKK